MTSEQLYAAYSNFSQPSLKVGYVDSFFSRGLAEGLARLQFKGHKGKSSDVNITKSRPTGSAARDPNSTTQPPSGKGETHLVSTYPGALARDFYTSIYAQAVQTDQQDQRAIDAMQSAESFFEEFVLQMLHGDGSWQERRLGESPDGNNLSGADWWLDQFSGKVKDGAFTSSTADKVRYYNSRYRDLKIFATSDGLPTTTVADKQVFSYEHLDKAIALIKGNKTGVCIVSDLNTYLRYLKTIRQEGGNTMMMQVTEDHNAEVNKHGAYPWFISDTCGQGKFSTGVAGQAGGKILVGDLDQLIIEGTGENDFIGWSDADVGRVVRVTGADFANGADSVAHAAATHPITGAPLGDDETVISAVTTSRSVTLLHAAGGAVANVDVESDNIPLCYVIRFGEVNDPFCAIYSTDNMATEQSYGVNLDGEYYGTIAGFEVKNLGIPSAGGLQVLHRAFWLGNFQNQNPFNIVRISGYKNA